MVEPMVESLIGLERLAELEALPHTVMVLRADDTLAYRNDAWTQFAVDNGAPELATWEGVDVLSVFHPAVREAYRDLFQRVRDSGEPEDHVYQCSSPEVYREFRLRVRPVGEGYLLLIHFPATEREHHWPAMAPGPRYVDRHAIITQCCHCRRTRRADAPDTWDWVPGYLDRTRTDVSHGLCSPCFVRYYR